MKRWRKKRRRLISCWLLFSPKYDRRWRHKVRQLRTWKTKETPLAIENLIKTLKQTEMDISRLDCVCTEYFRDCIWPLQTQKSRCQVDDGLVTVTNHAKCWILNMKQTKFFEWHHSCARSIFGCVCIEGIELSWVNTLGVHCFVF